MTETLTLQEKHSGEMAASLHCPTGLLCDVMQIALPLHFACLGSTQAVGLGEFAFGGTVCPFSMSPEETLDIFTSLECFAQKHVLAETKSGPPILQRSQTNKIFVGNIFKPYLG